MNKPLTPRDVAMLAAFAAMTRPWAPSALRAIQTTRRLAGYGLLEETTTPGQYRITEAGRVQAKLLAQV